MCSKRRDPQRDALDQAGRIGVDITGDRQQRAAQAW